MRTLLYCVLALLSVEGSLCWDQEELDLFDLVEEIEENFYDIMGVDQTASPSEIKKAYRQLSLKLHPDKSDDPDATEKFRKLVAVAEVLKDEQKREWYDQILVEGLPDWKQPLFYYRRVRKMGILELSVLVMLIATVAHYLYGWAVYVERRLVLQELLSRKQKKEERKAKKSFKAVSYQLEAELEYQTAQAKASIPSLRNLLPVVLAKGSISLARYSWALCSQWRESLLSFLRERVSSKKKEDSQEEESEDEKTGPRRRSSRKRVQEGHTEKKVEGYHAEKKVEGQHEEKVDVSEATEGQSDEPAVESDVVEEKVKGQREVLSNGIGTSEMYECGSYEDQLEAIMNDLDDDDYEDRTKKGHATKSAAMTSVAMETHESSLKQDKKKNRTKPLPPKGREDTQPLGERVPSVGNGDRNGGASVNGDHEPLTPTQSDHVPFDHGAEIRNSTHTHPRLPLTEVKTNDSWTQYQQTQLEWALSQYPKFSKDRWENVAKAVPGKTMDECVSRCKVLFEAVRRRKGEVEDS